MLRNILPALAVLFTLLFFNSNLEAQARLDFLQSTSAISAHSYSELQSPIAGPPCPPPESQGDDQMQFVSLPLLDRIYGGAYSRIKRGRGNCVISSQGTANVVIDNPGTATVKIQWWCHSNTQYDCKDPDCPWYATDTSSMDATVQLLVTGIPDGVPVKVFYFWKHFSSFANEPEAIDEDYAEIHNTSLNLLNRTGFGANMSVGGNFKFFQRRTGDSTQVFTAYNGDTLTMDVSALTTAHIEPPAKFPSNPKEDDASSDFYGYAYIMVSTTNTPPASPSYNCPSATILYSVDIGSDVEFSDPTPDGLELLDPGDLYAMGGATPVPFFDDTLIYGFDPAPATGNPAMTCFPGPLQPFQDVLNFDMDGADRIDYDLAANMADYGPGMPSLVPNLTNCIGDPSNMILSYDEDRGINFNSAVNCNVPSQFTPADSIYLKGTVAGHDEVMMASLYNIPGTATYLGSSAPLLNEQDLSPLLAPSPVSIYPPDLNDDVDALDIFEDPAFCLAQYFSVDHEAHYTYGPDTLLPGAVYQYTGSNTIQRVIHPVTHLGLNEDIDIDAFEFAYVYDSSAGRSGLALVFSVSSNDPFDIVDYTGGLDPATLYASFLDGTFFELVPAVHTGNIDGVAFATCLPNANGSVYVQPQTIRLNLRAFLGGPYAGNGIMHDSLRRAGYIPLSQPHNSTFTHHAPGGGEVMNASALLVSDSNAIVDWVFVELRDKNDSTVVEATRSGLIQRDGDIVDVDGTSPLTFNGVEADDYYVVVRHLNHLGVMTASPVALGASTVDVDFTDPNTATYGTNAQDTEAGIMMLWSGDVFKDGIIKYSGINNDRDRILQKIGGLVPTNVVMGYHVEDVNMDGLVKYSGLDNDRDIILQNIGGAIPTATILEQLPE